MLLWIHAIGWAILHSSPVCLTHGHTHTHTQHATCDICSNRPHLRTACMPCGPIIIIMIITRKHRHSYRHADPRRQPQHTAVAARVTSNYRATVTVFVTVWPWPLTFWSLGLLANECRATTIEYMCAKFGMVRARTDRQTNSQTRLNALPTPAAIQPAWLIVIILIKPIPCWCSWCCSALIDIDVVIARAESLPASCDECRLSIKQPRTFKPS